MSHCNSPFARFSILSRICFPCSTLHNSANPRNYRCAIAIHLPGLNIDTTQFKQRCYKITTTIYRTRKATPSLYRHQTLPPQIPHYPVKSPRTTKPRSPAKGAEQKKKPTTPPSNPHPSKTKTKTKTKNQRAKSASRNLFESARMAATEFFPRRGDRRSGGRKRV